MSLFSLFNPAKDYALGVTVRLWFNQTYKRYGQMTTIHIDSTAKTIHLELDLEGEAAPIVIDVKSYRLGSVSGETTIELGEIETSRGWINQLVADYLPPDKKSFSVPGAVKVLL